jgi:hypothetical protein
MPDSSALFMVEAQRIWLSHFGPAEVTAVCGEQVEVSVQGRRLMARLAVAGLYRLVAGDTVLVAEANEAYVIGVLHATGPMTVSAPQDLILAAPHGRIMLQANEINGTADELRLSAGTMSLTADRLVGCFATLRQVVSGLFELDAGGAALRVKEMFSLLTGRLRATAAEDVSIDGKQIHLG